MGFQRQMNVRNNSLGRKPKPNANFPPSDYLEAGPVLVSIRCQMLGDVQCIRGVVH